METRLMNKRQRKKLVKKANNEALNDLKEAMINVNTTSDSNNNRQRNGKYGCSDRISDLPC